MGATFLLTVGSFLLTAELFCLQLCLGALVLTARAFLVTARAFLLTVVFGSFSAYNLNFLHTDRFFAYSKKHLDGL